MHTARNFAHLRTLIAFLTIVAIGAALTAEAQEVIDATATGTSTQLGKIFNIKLIVDRYSTPEDKKTLDAAFAKGQNQGLVNALEKMKAVGRIQIPGTVGYDVAYISLTTTPTGRTIWFVTNRKIAFQEAYRNTPFTGLQPLGRRNRHQRYGSEQKRWCVVSGGATGHQQRRRSSGRTAQEPVAPGEHHCARKDKGIVGGPTGRFLRSLGCEALPCSKNLLPGIARQPMLPLIEVGDLEDGALREFQVAPA
jgi:hypothetical protein